ncbi:hypothetical protein FKM82_026500 [Ascaphus truei]
MLRSSGVRLTHALSRLGSTFCPFQELLASQGKVRKVVPTGGLAVHVRNRTINPIKMPAAHSQSDSPKINQETSKVSFSGSGVRG